MANVIVADKTRTDGPAYEMLKRIQTDIPILLISRTEELNFNEEVLSLAGKPFVVADYIENGWCFEFSETLIIGKNLKDFNFLSGNGWERLDDFIRLNPPQLYFKRELLSKDRTETILPIEYPNWQPDYQLQSKEEFDNRMVSAFFYWGRSHEARLMLQGEIWKTAARKGYAVCDNLYYINPFLSLDTNKNKFITLNIEHYSRIDISELMKINAISKLSISLPGCGIKCFRSGEAIVNSICVLPEDNLSYSLPFVHGINCIKFPIESVDGISKEWNVMGAIESALKLPNLYDVYVASKRVADFYSIDNYTSYLANLINKI